MSSVQSSESSFSLSRMGGVLAFIQAFSVVFAIVGYFLWPHVFADHDAQMVFEGIRRAPAEYFMKLDPIVLIGTLLQLPVYLGLWATLRQVDAAKSTLALTLGVLSTVAVLTVRPIGELYSLAAHYDSALNLEQRQVFLAAGEALLAQFHGTAWAISIISGGLSAIVFAIVMRETTDFQNATVWTMAISGAGALLIWVPYIGLFALFVLGTVVGVVGSILCGVDLLRLSNKLTEHSYPA